MEGALSPYRSKPERQHTGPRGEDVRWRRRTSAGALALIVWFMAHVVHAVILGALGLWLDGIGESRVLAALSLIVFGVGELVAVWLYTTPRPAPRFRRSIVVAWSLRALVVASFVLHLASVAVPALSVAPVFVEGPRHSFEPGTTVFWLGGVIGVLLPLAGLEYLRMMFRELDLPREERIARRLLLAPAIAPLAVLVFALVACRGVGIVAGVMLLLGTGYWLVKSLLLVVTLRRALRVRRHEWWLAETQLPDYEWASLVVLDDARAEVLTADGIRHGFGDRRAALAWLATSRFLAEDAARSRGLASWVPPPPGN